MTIDFNYPVKTSEGWSIEIHKEFRDGRKHAQVVKFADEKSALEYYNKAKSVWSNLSPQRSR